MVGMFEGAVPRMSYYLVMRCSEKLLTEKIRGA